MGAFADKTLWAEAMDDAADRARILSQAAQIGAGGVAIRTRSALLESSIESFHDAGLKVYGWRWPAIVPHPSGGRYALDEAQFVVDHLIPKGLDGYIADPESEQDKADNDWNRTNDLVVPLPELAASMCAMIRKGAHDAGRNDFAMGLTSGGNFPASRPHIPWKAFVDGSDALFPQLYWRARDKHDVCKTVLDGTPKTIFDTCLPSWRAIAQGKPIVALAGEISCVQDTAEFTAFAKRAKDEGLNTLHFYTSDGHLSAAQCTALKAL